MVIEYKEPRFIESLASSFLDVAVFVEDQTEVLGVEQFEMIKELDQIRQIEVINQDAINVNFDQFNLKWFEKQIMINPNTGCIEQIQIGDQSIVESP